MAASRFCWSNRTQKGRWRWQIVQSSCNVGKLSLPEQRGMSNGTRRCRRLIWRDRKKVSETYNAAQHNLYVSVGRCRRPRFSFVAFLLGSNSVTWRSSQSLLFHHFLFHHIVTTVCVHDCEVPCRNN